jgi:hypothetical protein
MQPLVRINIGLKASQLGAGTISTLLRETITAQMQIIDENIRQAHEMGLSELSYELPTTFNFGSLSKADSQLLVYSELVKMYSYSESNGGKGFPSVKISANANSPKIIISWRNSIPAQEKQARLNLLKGAGM